MFAKRSWTVLSPALYLKKGGPSQTGPTTDEKPEKLMDNLKTFSQNKHSTNTLLMNTTSKG